MGPLADNGVRPQAEWMPSATVRLYGCLNDFLASSAPPEQVATFSGSPAVRDLLESLGPPHVEIELLLIDGEPKPFSSRVNDGARVAAYPAFHGIDVPKELLATPPIKDVRFLLDGHLGTLARNLRLLGFDAEYEQNPADEALAAASVGRILLSRDLGLLKRTAVIHGYFPRSTDPRHQLAEVVRRFELKALARPFTRCLQCNGPLREVSKASVLASLPPHTAQTQGRFKQCGACGQVFWAGSHHAKLQKLVDEVLAGP
ncbi:MAG: Mut7-C RNAse domain-containing protein [Myxococcaceae bacterium]